MKKTKFITLIAIIFTFQLTIGQIPSLFNDGWTDVEEGKKEVVFNALKIMLKQRNYESGSFLEIRKRKLLCYDSVALYEIKAKKNGSDILYNILADGKNAQLLDGTNKGIKNINNQNRLIIDSNDKIFEYLKLFTGSLNAGEGKFSLFESKDEYNIIFHESYPIKTITEKYSELKIISSDEKKIVQGVMLYGDNLFLANFSINDSNVDLVEDFPILDKLPIKVLSYKEGGIVFNESTMYKKFDETVQKFAENGDARAQYKLGSKTMITDLNPEETKIALKWLEKSAEQSFQPAMDLLCFYYENGFLLNDEREKKYDYLNYQVIIKSVDVCAVNNPVTQIKLAYDYFADKLISPNYSRARYWAKKAKENNLDGASRMLELVNEAETVDSKIEATKKLKQLHENGELDYLKSSDKKKN